MSQPTDRILTDDENLAVQGAMSWDQPTVDATQGNLSQTDARSKNIRLALIKLAALALQQS